MEKIIKDAAFKAVRPLLKEIKEVTKEAEEIADQKGGTNLKEAIKPLVDKAEDLQDEVKKGAKARKDILEKVGDAHDAIKDAHETISEAAKGAAKSSDVKSSQDEVSDDIKAMKAHAVKGINKVGKVAVKNQKYLKAIYKDLHH